MTVLSIATIAYLMIAGLAMLRTLSEASRSPAATPLGTLFGCLTCLLWLPILLALAVAPGLRRTQPDLSSGL